MKSNAKKSAAAKKAAEPMDPGAQERTAPEPPPMSERLCYAAQTLAAEVSDVFGIGSEYSAPNGRNVHLHVTFLDEDPDLFPLLALVQSDARVEEVIAEEGQVLVAFHNNPATYDIRDTFGLADAKAVLDEGGSLALDEDDDFVVEVGPGKDPDEEPDVDEVHRDAGTGQFVTEKFADEHPDTTVTETVD